MASTDDVNITFNQAPTVPDAGPDQSGAAMCGLTTVTLAANTPVVGTGAWTITAGAGGTVITPTSPTSTFTGLAGTSYTLRWTISNAPCTASTDDVNITFNQNPTVADAGPDQTGTAMCGLTTATLAANNPAIGIGTWSIIGGMGGTITTPGSPVSTFSGNAGTTYTLRWTIDNSPCAASTDDVNITFNQDPTTADAGLDQTGIGMCGLTITTLTANTPVIGTGSWSIISGLGGNITAANSPTSTFTGIAGSSYVLRWTIINPPCTATTDDVTITFNMIPIPTFTAQPGVTACTGTDVTYTTQSGQFNYTWTYTGLPGIDYSITSGGSLTDNSVTLKWLTAGSKTVTVNYANAVGCIPIVATSSTPTIVNPVLPVSVTIAPDANPLCAGATVTFTATPVNGGTTPAYQWYNGATPVGADSPTFSYIPTTGDVITVILTSNEICQSSGPATSNAITITVNPILPVSVSILADANPVCSGTAVNFTATSTNGGTTPAYQWYNGATPVGINGPMFSYIPTNGDVITAVLTSNEVCQSGGPSTSNAITMTVNPILPVSVTIVADANPVCSGTAVNFTATPTNGGTTPAYQWYNGATPVGINSPTFSYIPTTGDVITVILTSNEVCQSGGPATSNAVTMTVNPILPVSVSILADANPVCAGTAVNFTATPTNGGTTPAYQWYNGATPVGIDSPMFSYIPTIGDVITVVLTSNEVCQSGGPSTSNAITMTVNPILPVSVSIIADANPVCAGTTVNFTATPTNGGITPAYQWYNGATPVGINSPAFSYIPATGDVITIVLTSNEVCQSGGPATSNAVTMTVNPLPAITTTQVNVACFGGTTGTATAIATGGTGVYTYSWNTIPVQSSVTAMGLTAGTYIVTVIDGNGCTATGSATITEPATALSGTIASLANVSVPGGTDGSVTVAGSGGTSPYQYKIGSGVYQVSGTFGSLSAGSYTVTVQDINLCTFDVAITITEPAATLSGSISSQTNLACFGTSTGSITVTGSGGVAPYEYSLNSGTYQTSGTFSLLAAGTYIVTVRDTVLSTFDVSVTITQPTSSVGGSITSQTNVLCFGSNTGSVTVSGSGGTAPYQYKLGAGSYQASGTFATLTAGSYTVTVQDANLCTFDVAVTISQPLAVLSGNIASQTNVSCFGLTNGSVTITGSGGISPYMYSLNGGTFQLSGTFNNLAGAGYTISVQDANLCTANVSVTITEPAVLSLASTKVDVSCPGDADGSITLTISGGTQPYSVIWADGILTQDRQDIPGGTYSVVVTDKNGCAASLDVIVGITGSDKCIEIPTIITPNNDGVNDTWQIKNIDLFPNAEVFVFTRWGKLVFHSKNLAANPWNGTFEGTLLPTDSYHYVLHLNDGSKPRSGVISIIR
jgi:gliding motility-associated-like protein